MFYEMIAAELLNARAGFLHAQSFQEILRMAKGEMFVLNYLATREHQAHPGRISKEMEVSTARIAVLLKHLEEKGLVTRSDDPEDNRQILVELTEKGNEKIARFRQQTLVHTVAMLEYLGPDDARELLRIEKRVAEYYCKG